MNSWRKGASGRLGSAWIVKTKMHWCDVCVCRVCSLYIFIYFCHICQDIVSDRWWIENVQQKKRKASRYEKKKTTSQRYTSNVGRGPAETTSFIFSAHKFDWFRVQRTKGLVAATSDDQSTHYTHRFTGTDQDEINLAEKLQSDQSRSNYCIEFDRLLLYSNVRQSIMSTQPNQPCVCRWNLRPLCTAESRPSYIYYTLRWQWMAFMFTTVYLRARYSNCPNGHIAQCTPCAQFRVCISCEFIVLVFRVCLCVRACIE